MENLEKRAPKVAFYLQRLMDPSVFPEVQEAISRKDKNSFVAACKKVAIPSNYIIVLISILIATGVASPLYAWPP